MHHRVKKAKCSKPSARNSRDPIKDAQLNVITLVEDNPNALVELQAHKSAASQSAQLGLQARSALVSSVQRYGQHMSESANNAKLAMAANALDQLSSLVGELRSENLQYSKAAAALAGAVKLAQDGVIDIHEVFDHARNTITSGEVKTSELQEVCSPGEVVSTNREVSEPIKGAATQTLRHGSPYRSA